MSNPRRPGKSPTTVLRRIPKQERSKDRVSEILRVSADLIGEKGIDAVTMKEIGSRTGGPIASVYQYFPDKEAIVASLYEQYVSETRFILKGAVGNILTADDAVMAAELLVDAYYEVMRQGPSAIDIMNAIKASKVLAQQDLLETRLQVEDFYEATAHFVQEGRRDQYKTTLTLLFNMADASVRLALMRPQREASDILERFKEIVRVQAAYFLLGEFPEKLSSSASKVHARAQ
ncbi:TetR/AcrR family transcriptional regulator [Endobacterium cereale]|uniref:TetR/AcrR family transcriptional regulator n=1 Tax=Endobacterium cereale TaxID=2663029 RepID=UPI002B490F8D|nr:TetR/AcrR family transcriptional regulator [Endobacterium cereale]MEB2848545.1 TetR/AcrR family transcriptional regulator [Endobacterium cereale]